MEAAHSVKTINSINDSFPLFDKVTAYLMSSGRLNGKTIGWHCHLTELTALAVKAAIAGGAQVVLSECNSTTSQKHAIDYMRELGATIYLGANSVANTLAHKPHIISDTGLELISAYIEGRHNFAWAACEITTSGITRLKELGAGLSLPVVNINNSRIKTYIENFHGVGDGVVESLDLLGLVKERKVITVLGYGVVGAGAAYYLRKIGADVCVVELDPVRALIAHYDGFRVINLDKALGSSDIFISATGSIKAISREHWHKAKDGCVFINIGHWSQEFDLSQLEAMVTTKTQISTYVTEYSFEHKKIYVAAEGNPLNVVMLTGSPEPTLIHLATEVLCHDHLLNIAAKSQGKPIGELADSLELTPGEYPVPQVVEERVARMALEVLTS
jgi:adenosylhomocysteinase